MTATDLDIGEVAREQPSPAPLIVRLPPQLDVVIPVYNEEADIERCLLRLHEYLSSAVPCSFRVTVADNASTDGTLEVARRVAELLPEVRIVHLDAKGRGRALREVWLASDAQVLAYMDVDLSTDLAALLPLVAPLLSGHSDVAIGTRLSSRSRVVRGAKRELISRSYNVLIRMALSAQFSDAQCGFKAIRADRAQELLVYVEDNGWFFDTELLVLAERAGLRIHEVPVDWIDDPDSRVDVWQTVKDDVRGIVRLGRALSAGRVPVAESDDWVARSAGAQGGMIAQLVTFAVIGMVSTVAYVILYVMLRQGMSGQLANAIALGVTAVANTVVNRRVTFGVRGPNKRLRQLVQGLVVFAAGLVLTSGALAVLESIVVQPSRVLEVGVLLAASVAATFLRFLLYRAWVFPHRARRHAPDDEAASEAASTSLLHLSSADAITLTPDASGPDTTRTES